MRKRTWTKLLTFVLAAVLIFSISMLPALAAVPVPSSVSSGITPYAEELVTYTTVINGELYARRWSLTYGRWYDPEWVKVSI